MNPIFHVRKETQRGEAHPRPHTVSLQSAVSSSARMWTQVSLNPTLSDRLGNSFFILSCTISQFLLFTCLQTGSKIGQGIIILTFPQPQDWPHQGSPCPPSRPPKETYILFQIPDQKGSLEKGTVTPVRSPVQIQGLAWICAPWPSSIPCRPCPCGLVLALDKMSAGEF